MDNEEKMLSIVNALAKAKSKQDIAGALAIYHPEVELISPSFNSHARSRREVGQELTLFFSLFPDYEVEIEQYATKDKILLSTGQVKVTPNIAGKECAQITLPVFIEFHFKDNLIAKEVFSLDAGIICRKAGITADDLANATRAIYKKIKLSEQSS